MKKLYLLIVLSVGCTVSIDARGELGDARGELGDAGGELGDDCCYYLDEIENYEPGQPMPENVCRLPEYPGKKIHHCGDEE